MTGKPMKKQSEDIDPDAPLEHPGFGLIEVFWRHAPDKDGHYKKLSISERFERGMKLADYYSDKFSHWLKNREAPSNPNEADMALDMPSMRSSDDEQDEPGDGRDNSSKSHEDEPKVHRMNEPSSVRIFINPGDTEHMVGSEHIGPEHQVSLNRDPWPLDKPSEREAGAKVVMIADQSSQRVLSPPQSDENAKTPDQESKWSEAVKSSQQITDQRAHKNDTENTDRPVSDTAVKSRAQAASERGRDVAIRMTDRKAAVAPAEKPPSNREVEDDTR
jgi:hypothetical protein